MLTQKEHSRRRTRGHRTRRDSRISGPDETSTNNETGTYVCGVVGTLVRKGGEEVKWSTSNQ